jgi:chromosome segregation ATPase
MTDYTDLIARLRSAYVTASPDEAADALEEIAASREAVWKHAKMLEKDLLAHKERIAELERQLASSIVSGNDAREQCLEHVYALSAAALRIAELEGDLARERSTVTCVPRGWK